MQFSCLTGKASQSIICKTEGQKINNQQKNKTRCMSRRDIYHDSVKRALQKDGWTVTHDPFRLDIGEKSLSADLGAERLISAEKGLRKIVVEIKSFVGQSDVHDLEEAIGQYVVYLRILQKLHIERHLYLAVTERVFQTVFETELGQLFLEDHFVRVITFNEEEEVINRWIPE